MAAITIANNGIDNNNNFINTNTNESVIIFCLQCQSYNIYKIGTFDNNDNQYCLNCHSINIQNVFADEIKFHFNPATSTRKTALVKTNSPIIKERNYSWTIIKDMDNF